MVNAVVQLYAVGDQDAKLTKNPKITFFQARYEPYVNFAMQSIENTFYGSVDFGRTVYCEVQKSADLITHMIFQCTFPTLLATDTVATVGICWTPNPGHRLIDEAIIKIGGSNDVDTQYGLWYDLWAELTVPESKRYGYNEMIGQQNLIYTTGAPSTTGSGQAIAPVSLSYSGNQTPQLNAAGAKSAFKIYLPLRFWFNEHPGLALPLLAMINTSVRIQLKLRPLADMVCAYNTALTNAQYTYNFITSPSSSVSGTPTLTAASLWVDYIYLDARERTYFARNAHEYLITQLQYSQALNVTSQSVQADFTFNHPVRELVWVTQEDRALSRNLWNIYGCYGSTSTIPYGSDPYASLYLDVNGSRRFDPRDGDVFTRVQPYQHHTRIPQQNGIGVYSFAIDPEDYQPQGTMNFSRLDAAKLIIVYTNIGTSTTVAGVSATATGKLHIFGVNYNFLQVAGGVAGNVYGN